MTVSNERERRVRASGFELDRGSAPTVQVLGRGSNPIVSPNRDFSAPN